MSLLLLLLFKQKKDAVVIVIQMKGTGILLLLFFRQKKVARGTWLQKLIIRVLKNCQNVTKHSSNFNSTLKERRHNLILGKSFCFNCVKFVESQGRGGTLGKSGHRGVQRSSSRRDPIKEEGQDSIFVYVHNAHCIAQPPLCSASLLHLTSLPPQMELGKPLCTALAHNCFSFWYSPPGQMPSFL